MPRKPVIFRIIGNNESGTVRRRLALLLPKLTDDFAVHLIVCGSRDELFDKLAENGVTMHAFPGGNAWDPTAVRRLAKLFKKHKADIVHTHGLDCNIQGMLAARLADVPVRIAQIHTRPTHDQPGTAIGRQAQSVQEMTVLSLCAHCVLTASTQHKDTYSVQNRFLRHKFSVLHNGIDLSDLTAAPDASNAISLEFGLLPEHTVLGYVGKPQADAHIGFALAFMGKLVEERPNYRLLVAGPCGSRELQTLHDQAEAAGCRSQAIFVGWRDNMADFYRACDLLLFASNERRQGMPAVVLEACALGLPVLSRTNKAVAEIAGYYSRIHFMDDEDSPHGAVDAALSLPVDNGETFARHFSIQAMLLRTKKLYDQFLVSKGKLL